MMAKVIKKTNATGIKGMIMDYGEYFRVSFGRPINEQGDWYIDYKIFHPDMTVEITDSDAFLYEDDEGRFYIDMNDDLDNKMRAEIEASKNKS